LAYTVRDVLALTGIGKTTFYKLLKNGQLSTRKLGNQTVVLRADLNSFLEGLPLAGKKKSP
jgi:excisionase family DNA binding protein